MLRGGGELKFCVCVRGVLKSRGRASNLVSQPGSCDQALTASCIVILRDIFFGSRQLRAKILSNSWQ